MLYSIRLALKSLWFEKWIHMLTVVTIGVGLFVLGLVFFALYNIEGVASRLPERFSVTVFLSDRTGEREIDQLKARLSRDPIVESVKFISKDEALVELRSSLKDAAYILEGLDENPLFPSLEIRLKENGFDRKRVEALIDELRRLRSVDDVVYGEDLLGTIYTIRSGVKTLSAGVILLFSMAIVFVCYSTVKILFYRRKEEIEIFKLLGATRAFIRMPFLIEGGTLGFMGGLLGGAGTYGLYRFINGLVVTDFPMLGEMQLPLGLVAALPLGGAVLGIIGSTIALGRLKF
ncbi:MAG TPA: FtsX-like permease family protein [Nitrospirae bacterium]|nr:FtsX-like permease family protein [Nitrospirota bacterium]